MVPPRADLPDGVTNYVTPAGMEELKAERQMLADEKESLDSSNENEHRIALNLIHAKMQLLETRIATARIVEPDGRDPEVVRFGARVKLRNSTLHKTQAFQIVGVDEANISKGKIAFTAPIAKALINQRTGDKVVLKRGPEDLVFEILDIHYI